MFLLSFGFEFLELFRYFDVEVFALSEFGGASVHGAGFEVQEFEEGLFHVLETEGVFGSEQNFTEHFLL